MRTEIVTKASVHVNCPACEGTALTDRMVMEQVPFGEEDDSFEVELPMVECGDCGFSFTDNRAEELRHAAACRHQRLLAPTEVRAVRRDLGMSRREFEEAFGVTEASMERWENGRLFQSRSMNCLLKALQYKATATRVDDRRRPVAEPDLGVVVFGRFRALESRPSALDEARSRGAGFRPRMVG